MGPPLATQVAREDLIQQMEANGFHLVKEHTFLPYHYCLVFVSKSLDRWSCTADRSIRRWLEPSPPRTPAARPSEGAFPHRRIARLDLSEGALTAPVSEPSVAAPRAHGCCAMRALRHPELSGQPTA